MSQRTLNGTGTDTVVLVDATAANEVVPLPKGFATGRRFTVRRLDASVRTVTVTSQSGDAIDGTVGASKTVAVNSEATFVPLDPGRWESFGLASGTGGAVSSVAGQTGAVTGAQILADSSVAVALAAKADGAATTSALAGKASAAHASNHGAGGSDPVTVAQTQITGLSTSLAGKADLVAGVIPTAQLPPLAITNTAVVGSQAAMLALTAQRGDMAIRTDNSTTYVLSTDSPTTLADWKVLLAPGQIISVAGKTGVVALAGEDLTSGTVAFARLPVGTSSTTVARGNDSRLVGAVQSTTIPVIEQLTQAAYDALTPVSTTLYVIVG